MSSSAPANAVEEEARDVDAAEDDAVGSAKRTSFAECGFFFFGLSRREPPPPVGWNKPAKDDGDDDKGEPRPLPPIAGPAPQT